MDLKICKGSIVHQKSIGQHQNILKLNGKNI